WNNWWPIQRHASGKYRWQRRSKQFKYDPVDRKAHVHTTNNVISRIVGVDFNSLYPSVMSTAEHKLIKYTGGKMHMAGSGDTDSAYWAVSGDANAENLQQFNQVIRDKQFYDENAKYYFPKQSLQRTETIEGDFLDEKKVFGLAIENEGTEMIALAHKIYYIKATNIRLEKKNYIMPKIETQKNGITGIHTKAIILKDQSCCPYVYDLKASDYVID
ncbi:MAG: hypothetical protein EZS28_018647, partial [Streblomastix strix]